MHVGSRYLGSVRVGFEDIISAVEFQSLNLTTNNETHSGNTIHHSNSAQLMLIWHFFTKSLKCSQKPARNRQIC